MVCATKQRAKKQRAKKQRARKTAEKFCCEQETNPEERTIIHFKINVKGRLKCSRSAAPNGYI